MPVKLPSPEIAVVGAMRCGDAVGNWDPGLGSLRGCCGDRALEHLITQKPLANAKQKANNFLFFLPRSRCSFLCFALPNMREF